MQEIIKHDTKDVCPRGHYKRLKWIEAQACHSLEESPHPLMIPYWRSGNVGQW